MQWTIPNILTVGRILAAPGMALVFAFLDRPTADWVALILFIVAALTDFFDGWLARRLSQITEIGKMLDPIADKAMVIVGLMIVLANANPMAVDAGYSLPMLLIPAAIIGLREVLISGMREFLGDVKLPVTPIAKWKTTAQLVAVGAALFMGAFEPGVNEAFSTAMPQNNGQAIYPLPGEVLFHQIYTTSGYATVALFYLAALLTLASGWDYFRKGLAYIRMREEN